MKCIRNILIMLCISFIFVGCGAEKEVKEDYIGSYILQLEQCTYEEAEEYYLSKIAKNEELVAQTETRLLERMWENVDEFNKGNLSYDEIIELSMIYENVLPYEHVLDIDLRIAELNGSKLDFAMGEECFNYQNYLQAVFYYREVSSEDVNYAIAQSRIKECSELFFQNKQKEWEALAQSGDYLSAIEIISENLSLFENSQISLAKKTMEEYRDKYIDAVVGQVENNLENGEYKEGFSLISEARAAVGDQGKLTDIENKVAEKYEESVVESVQQYKNVQRYTEGLLLIKAAQIYIPDSQALEEEYQELQKYEPIELADIYIFDSNTKYYRKTNCKDTYQNEYDFALSCSMYTGPEDTEWAEYLLKGNYEHFSAILAPGDGWKNSKELIVSIYADDILLFEKKMTRETKPIVINLDVTGVEMLKIVMEKCDYYGTYTVLLAEAYVYGKY